MSGVNVYDVVYSPRRIITGRNIPIIFEGAGIPDIWPCLAGEHIHEHAMNFLTIELQHRWVDVADGNVREAIDVADLVEDIGPELSLRKGEALIFASRTGIGTTTRTGIGASACL